MALFLGSCPLAERKLPENPFECSNAEWKLEEEEIKVVIPKYVRTETVSSILRPHMGNKLNYWAKKAAWIRNFVEVS